MNEEPASGPEGVLGRDVRGSIDADQIQTVPWSHPGSDATVEFSTDELTAFCPVTGQPDFYELNLSYRPARRLIESKALKLYLWGFRDKGAFAEDMAATILDDLVAACEPEQMTVDLTQKVRGGLKLRTVVRHGPNAGSS
ncbi:MAG: preQ(1) synthase [Rubrobacter sp.]|nr:preQ(1) synthase [Rubrobacter sp.]